MANIYDYY